MRVLAFGATDGFVDYQPNNTPVSVPLLDVNGNAVTLSNLRACVVVAGSTDHVPSASAQANGRDLATSMTLQTTQVVLDANNAASSTNPVRLSGFVLDGQDDVGTDAEIRQLSKITSTFSGTKLGTQSIEAFDQTGVDWAKVVYMHQGAESAAAVTRQDSYVGFTAEPDGVGGYAIQRSDDQHDCVLIGSPVWFKGSGWKVHRRRCTNSDLTWLATADANDGLLYADIDMYENGTGIAGGSVSNPDWSAKLFAEGRKRWVTEPASNLLRRGVNIYSWPVSEGAGGKCRIWRSDDSVVEADLTFQLTVVTHTGIGSEDNSEIVGAIWGGIDNDGSTRGFGFESFGDAADDQIFPHVEMVSGETAADSRENWQPSLVTAQGMQVYNLSTGNDAYLVIGQAADISQIGVNAIPDGPGDWVGLLDVYDGVAVFSGDTLPAGNVIEVTITSVSGSNVFTEFQAVGDSAVGINMEALGYTFEGPQGHMPFDQLLQVSITNGTDTVDSSLIVPNPPAYEIFNIAADSADLLASAPDAMASLLHAEGFPSIAGDEYIVQNTISVNEFTVLDAPVTEGVEAFVNRYSESTGWARTLCWIAGNPVASAMSVTPGIAQTKPQDGYDFLQLDDALSSISDLPAAYVGNVIEWETLADTLAFNSNGERTYAGTSTQTYQARYWNGATWSAYETLTVYPDINAAVPAWVESSYAVGQLAVLDANDLFNSALDHPNAAVSIAGFPGTSSVAGDQVTIDTSAGGTSPVQVIATNNGREFHVVTFDLVITDSLLQLAPLRHGHTIDTVNIGAAVGNVSLTLDGVNHEHALAATAIGSINVSLALQPIAQAHNLAALGALAESMAVEVESVKHAQTIAPLLLALNIPAAALQHGHAVDVVTGLNGISTNLAALQHGHSMDTVVGVGVAMLIDALIQHGTTLEAIPGILSVGIPGLVDINHVQVLGEVGTLNVGILLVDMVTHRHNIDDCAVVPNTPLVLTGPLSHGHTLQEFTDTLFANNLVPAADVIHVQTLGGNIDVAQRNRPLIPADGAVVIRSNTTQ